jgi:hypothetical protein
VGVPTSLLDRELDSRLKQVLADSPTWEKRKDTLAARELEARETAANTRNLARRELASVRDPAGNLLHPQYQTDFALDDLILLNRFLAEGGEAKDRKHRRDRPDRHRGRIFADAHNFPNSLKPTRVNP